MTPHASRRVALASPMLWRRPTTQPIRSLRARLRCSSARCLRNCSAISRTVATRNAACPPGSSQAGDAGAREPARDTFAPRIAVNSLTALYWNCWSSWSVTSTLPSTSRCFRRASNCISGCRVPKPHGNASRASRTMTEHARWPQRVSLMHPVLVRRAVNRTIGMIRRSGRSLSAAATTRAPIRCSRPLCGVPSMLLLDRSLIPRVADATARTLQLRARASLVLAPERAGRPRPGRDQDGR